MLSLVRILIILMPVLLPVSCAKNKASAGFKSKRVIIVVMDGARYSETWGDTSHQYAPNLEILASQGCMFTNFYKENHTFTCSGHTELLTGVDQDIDNTGLELPDYASFMQYALDMFDYPSGKAYIVSSKDKLHVLTDCKNASMAGQHKPTFYGGINGPGTGYCHDSVTIKRVYEVMTQYAPDFMLINFREPDFSAHAGDSIGYLKGIRYVDSCFNLIYSWTQTLSAYSGQTALFFTNDHGRHLDTVATGFKDHGDLCEGCRHVFLYATGPDFAKNKIVSAHYALRDVAGTVAFMKKLVMPFNQGRLIPELFK